MMTNVLWILVLACYLNNGRHGIVSGSTETISTATSMVLEETTTTPTALNITSTTNTDRLTEAPTTSTTSVPTETTSTTRSETSTTTTASTTTTDTSTTSTASTTTTETSTTSTASKTTTETSTINRNELTEAPTTLTPTEATSTTTTETSTTEKDELTDTPTTSSPAETTTTTETTSTAVTTTETSTTTTSSALETTTRTTVPSTTAKTTLPVIENPCAILPCPTNSSCIVTDAGRGYCVCNGNFKGDDCTQPDTLVKCRSHTSLKYDVRKSSPAPIHCFPYRSAADSICQDPDDKLAFQLLKASPDFFYLTEVSGNQSCLHVNATFITNSRYCVALMAAEEDDMVYRPWRNASGDVCVTFNEGPMFSNRSITMLVNARTTFKAGDVLIMLYVTDSFVSNGFTFKVLETSPQSKLNMFRQDGPNLTLAENLSNITKEDVSLKIEVSDNGIPPLMDTTSLHLTFVNQTLFCSAKPQTVFVNILDINELESVSQLYCDGGTADVTFTVSTDSKVLQVSVGERGAVSLKTDGLSPGTYTAVVNATKSPFGVTEIILTVNVGMSPQCGLLKPEGFTLEEAEPIGTCLNIASNCSYTPANPSVSFNSPNDLTASFWLKIQRTVVSLCLNSSLIGKTGTHMIGITVTNQYGKLDLSVKLNITKSNVHSPVFFISLVSTTTVETSPVGTDILSTAATDADGDVIRYYVVGNVPFSYVSVSQPTIITTQKLNATKENRYSFTINAVDGERGTPKTRTATGTVEISVTDINEPPVCPPALNFSVEDTASSGLVIGNVSCFDVDKDAINRRLSYKLQTPLSVVKGLLAVNNKGEIILQKEMTAEFKDYQFVINVTDGGGLSTTVNVTISVLSPPPECSPRKTKGFTIESASPVSSCVVVAVSCSVSPAISVRFKSPTVFTSYFRLETSGTNVSLCVNDTGLYFKNVVGSHLIQIEVTNPFGQLDLTVNLTITQSNLHAPVFSNLPSAINIMENAATGSIVLRITAVDKDVNSIINYYVQGTVPFKFNSTSQPDLIVTQKLNATKNHQYQVPLLIVDGAKGDSNTKSATSTVTVNVEDVNETPICPDEQHYTVDATAKTGYKVGNVSCFDVDRKDAYRNVSYLLTTTTDLISISGSGEITLTKDMASASDKYKFIVNVTDGGGLTVKAKIYIHVNKYFAPVCPKPLLHVEVQDNSSVSNCVTLGTACINPIGGNLLFDIMGGNGSRYFQLIASTDKGVVSICPQQSILGNIITVQITVNVSNGFNNTEFSVVISIVEVNDAPVFLKSFYNFTISEKVTVNHGVGRVLAVDSDVLSSNNIITYEVGDDTNSKGFKINSASGEITTIKPFNASENSVLIFNVMAKDPQGLLATAVVDVNIVDINDPPVCDPTTISGLTLALTTAVGTNVAKVNCWDWDLTSPMNSIVYEIRGDFSEGFRVNTDGTIVTTSPIPRNISPTFVLNVLVQDSFMQSNGITSGLVSISVTINVNTNFPPNCSLVNIEAKLSEFERIGSCLPQSVICTDPTKGNVTLKSQGGVGSEFEVRSDRVPGTNPGLRMNICTKASLKDKIKTYIIAVTLTNGFGDTSIKWLVVVEDVNEAPYFKASPYNTTIPENSGGGTNILKVTYDDPDTYPNFKEVNVTYKALSLGTADSKEISFVQDCCFIVTGVLNATKKNLYQFEITLTDGGNLSTSSMVSINIADVNEPPVCSKDPTILNGVPVMTAVHTVIGRLSCYDVDLDAKNRQLQYSDNSDYFNITSNGEITVVKLLPRMTSVHNIQVTVSDMGSPALSAKPSLVTVNVDNKVPVNCQPTVEYPQVWVKGQCVSLVMNCVDPTKSGIAHLNFSTSGNFSLGFNVQNPSLGRYKLCYNLIQSGYFYLTVEVDNQLATFTFNQPLQVIYEQSNPQFSPSVYSTAISENITVGSSVVKVTAVTKSLNGSIVYSITGGSWQNISSIFGINSVSGVISTKISLRSIADQSLKIVVQALNDFSLLKSTATVEVTVNDINEAPNCKQLGEEVVTVQVNSNVGATLFSAKCTEVDVNVDNKRMTATLTSQPHIPGLFSLEYKDGEITVKTGKPWPVTEALYSVTVNVSDAGSPPLSAILSYLVNVVLLPPAPILKSTPINSSAILVEWKFDREDFYTVTQTFRLVIMSGKEVPDFQADFDSQITQKVVANLQPETLHIVTLSAVTRYGTVNARSVNVNTPAVPILENIIVSVKLTGETFVSTLYDRKSFVFVTLQRKVEANFGFVLRSVAGFISVKIETFRPGSVIADAVITKNQSSTVTGLSSVLQRAVQSGWVGNLSVDPNYFVQNIADGYISISSLVKNESDIYQGMDLALTCTADVVGSVGSVYGVWRVNDAVINPRSNSRWMLREEPVDQNFIYRRTYTLIVRNIRDKDSGNYSCTVKNNQSLSDRKDLDIFVLAQPEVVITPRTKTVREGEMVNVTCRVTHPLSPYYAFFRWYRNGVEFDANSYETGEKIVRTSVYISNVVKENIKSSVQYSCVAHNNAGLGNRAVSDISVIPKDEDEVKVCSQQNDSYGFVWEMTVANSKSIQPCLAGSSGTAVRQCSDNGKWLEADYSGCVRNDLAKVAEETGKMIEGVAVSTPENTLSQLANLTSQDKGALQTGDVDVSVTILDNVNELTQEDSEKVTDNSVEAFAQTTSNLLDDINRPVWLWKKDQNKKGVSKLMKAATDFGKISTKKGLQQAGGLLKIKDNIVMQVNEVGINNDIVFPDNILSNTPAWLKSKKTQVKVSSATLKALGAHESGQQRFGQSAIFYRNISDLIDSKLYTDRNDASPKSNLDINSDVVDFSIVPANTALSPPLEILFQHTSVDFSDPVCAFLDFTIPNSENGGWSMKGCKLTSTSDTESRCECDHVTNFALLMSPGKTPPAHELPLSIISAVGIGLSILFLLITIGMYFAFWRYVKSDRSTILMHLCVALVLAYIIFLAGINRTENKDACTAVAAILHYVFLVVFFIMLAEGIEMAISVLYVFSTRSRIHWLLPLSWILPAVVVGISLGVTELDGYGNDKFCWLSTYSAVFWAFVGPALFVIVVNFIIFALVMHKLFNTHTMLTKTTKEQAKAGLRSMLVILPIMGLSWVLGVFSVNEDLVIFQYLFAICNTLQGFFIFLFHCLLNNQMKDAIQHNNRRKRSLADFSKSTSQSTNLKASQKESQEPKQNNIIIEKKENPFLEADKQVQELLEKIHKVNDNNAYDASDDRDKNLVKDQVVGLDDIKIVNLLAGNDQSASSVPSSSSNQMRRSQGDTVDSNKKPNTYDQLNLQESYHRYDNPAPSAYSGRQLTPSQASWAQTVPPKSQEPQASSGSSETRSTERYSLSNKSSNADDDLEIFFALFDMSDSEMSDDSNIFTIERENRSRLDHVYSFSQKDSDGSKGSKDKGRKKKDEYDTEIKSKNVDAAQKHPIEDLEPKPPETRYRQKIQIYAPTIQTNPDVQNRQSEILPRQRLPGGPNHQENLPRQRMTDGQNRQEHLSRQAMLNRQDQQGNLPRQRMPDSMQDRQDDLPRQRMPDRQNNQENLSRQRMPEHYSSQGKLPQQRIPDVQTRQPGDGAGQRTAQSRQRAEMQPRQRAEMLDNRQKYYQPAQQRQQEPVYEVAKKSQKKSSSHWGKKDKDKPRSGSKERRRQYDRSRAYAVDYAYPSQPSHQSQARHTSLEDISMHYVGFQPFGGIRSYDNIRPVPADQYDYPMPWHDPSSGYW